MIWTKTGTEYTDTPPKREAIQAEIARLTWHNLADDPHAPMMPGLALQDICREIRGHHRKVAWNGVVFDRYGLYGLETGYRNGTCWSYWLDEGAAQVCVCHKFEARPEEEA